MAVNPIPPGHHTVTPYLLVGNASKQIEFLQKAFDAVEMHRTQLPDGSVMHAEVRIGDSAVMMGEAKGGWGAMPAFLYLYMSDVDATYKKAIDAGATSMREPVDEFYGDRCAGVKDHEGNVWWIATHKEDLSAEEIEKRRQVAMKGK